MARAWRRRKGRARAESGNDGKGMIEVCCCGLCFVMLVCSVPLPCLMSLTLRSFVRIYFDQDDPQSALFCTAWVFRTLDASILCLFWGWQCSFIRPAGRAGCVSRLFSRYFACSGLHTRPGCIWVWPWLQTRASLTHFGIKQSCGYSDGFLDADHSTEEELSNPRLGCIGLRLTWTVKSIPMRDSSDWITSLEFVSRFSSAFEGAKRKLKAGILEQDNNASCCSAVGLLPRQCLRMTHSG